MEGGGWGEGGGNLSHTTPSISMHCWNWVRHLAYYREENTPWVGALYDFKEVLRVVDGVSTGYTLLKQQDCPHSEHSGIGNPHPLQICATVTI